MANHDQRAGRRATAAMRQMYRALARLGIDLETIPSTNGEAIDLARRNTDALRAIENAMRKKAAAGPTPERVAHAVRPPREIEILPDQPKAYKFEWELEGLRDKLTGRQYQAACRLRDAYEASQPASRVADPTAVGGSADPSKRLAITEAQELAGRDLFAVRKRLARRFRSTLWNFVIEAPKLGSERCLTISEWGSRLTGYSGDMARAAGVVAILDACEHLADAYDDVDREAREQCARTDRLMRSEIGRRAAQGGWIIALWTWAHRKGRLPSVQGEVDEIRAIHDTDVKALRAAPPVELDRWHRRRDRLTAVAFRDDERRVRVA